jgi:hypothetical protein
LTEPQHQTTPLPGWAQRAFTLVAEPAFVPRALQPATIVGGLLDWMVPAILDAVFKRVDLTALVIDKVSIPRIVDSIDLNALAARIDIQALIAQIDISGIAKQVIDDIDLGGIIRDSSGALASETVVGVRLQSASADDALQRVVGRFLPGRRRNDRVDHTAGNGADQGAPSGDGV